MAVHVSPPLSILFGCGALNHVFHWAPAVFIGVVSVVVVIVGIVGPGFAALRQCRRSRPRITLPSGQVVTAPNPAAAKAVRNALNQPAGKGDVATLAYAGTGVTIPTDGADPGRKIHPSDLQPGDIAVFDDHTAIVAGNGQLVGPDGKLQPLGVINDTPGFKGVFAAC
jgi:hypothetical protein